MKSTVNELHARFEDRYILRGRVWYNPSSNTVDNNKKVTMLELWSGAYQEIGLSWACLGLQRNFWAQVQNWRRSI